MYLLFSVVNMWTHGTFIDPWKIAIFPLIINSFVNVVAKNDPMVNAPFVMISHGIHEPDPIFASHTLEYIFCDGLGAENYLNDTLTEFKNYCDDLKQNYTSLQKFLRSTFVGREGNFVLLSGLFPLAQGNDCLYCLKKGGL